MCKRTSAAPLSGTIKPYPFATSNHLTRPEISTRSTASIADSSGVASKSNRREAKFLPSKDQPPRNRARGRNEFPHAARRLTVRIAASIAFGRRCKSPIAQEIVDEVRKIIRAALAPLVASSCDGGRPVLLGVRMMDGLG